MKLRRRRFLHLAAGAAALPAVSRIAQAQAYPTRPVRIIVPFPAGQATDTMARLMGQSLLERLGPFVIENRTGAGAGLEGGPSARVDASQGLPQRSRLASAFDPYACCPLRRVEGKGRRPYLTTGGRRCLSKPRNGRMADAGALPDRSV